MVNYECNDCKKKFTKKYNYDYHVNRKYPCKPIHINIKKTYKCLYCELVYTRKFNLDKHMATHKQEIEREKLLDEIIEERRQIINDNNNPNINNTQNNINNLNNLNLQLTPFGKEDLSFITDAECKKILGRGFSAVTALIEYVHFDEKKPELQNCYTSNNRDKFSITYDGAKWNLVETADVIQSLREKSEGFLDKKFDGLANTMGPQGARRFRNYLKNKNDKELIQRHKKEIKMYLYNNRDMVKKNRDSYDKQQKLLKC
jgi:hypothetical protein